MPESALSGYRVLDLADESGLFGTKLMADLGADVIKVEPPTGDKTRRLPPFYQGQIGPESSLYFTYMNTNKRSITLELESAEGQALFRELAKRADLIYETFPPGYMDDRGIGHKELGRLNPNLVWVALTPFGQTGPRRDWAGSDLIGWALSGVQYTNGFPDRPPVAPAQPASLAYSLASINAAIGGLLALRARERTGRGQLVDISLQEAMVAISTEAGLPSFLDDMIPRVRQGNRRQVTRPFGLYPCKDGFVAVVIVSGSHWIALTQWIKEVTGVEEVTDPIFRDILYRGQVAELIDGWTEDLTTRFTKQELFEEAQRRGITITPVNTMEDLAKDPHLKARNYWAEISHPVLGNLKMAGAPYQLSDTPWQPGRAPLLGEHNEAIYCGELGLTRDDLSTLRANGVV